MLKEKLLGSDLSALASSNGISIQTANDLSFANVTLPSVGNEPKVVATALGLSLNEVSSPISLENGKYTFVSNFQDYLNDVNNFNVKYGVNLVVPPTQE